MRNWLVEISLKKWRPDLKSGGRVVTYIEVVAEDEYYARHKGFEVFEKEVKYKPSLRAILNENGLSMSDCCAPDAVII